MEGLAAKLNPPTHCSAPGVFGADRVLRENVGHWLSALGQTLAIYGFTAAVEHLGGVLVDVWGRGSCDTHVTVM